MESDSELLNRTESNAEHNRKEMLKPKGQPRTFYHSAKKPLLIFFNRYERPKPEQPSCTG